MYYITKLKKTFKQRLCAQAQNAKQADILKSDSLLNTYLRRKREQKYLKKPYFLIASFAWFFICFVIRIWEDIIAPFGEVLRPVPALPIGIEITYVT